MINFVRLVKLVSQSLVERERNKAQRSQKWEWERNKAQRSQSYCQLTTKTPDVTLYSCIVVHKLKFRIFYFVTSNLDSPITLHVTDYLFMPKIYWYVT